MSGFKRFIALAALWGLLLSAPVWALNAEPAAGSQVAPGDSIGYTYTLGQDMENCVLRLALAPGLTVRADSVQVKGGGAEVVYGSDGFVVMADKLSKGDTIVFVAEVGPAALEAWARMTSADGSITEADGYVSHSLALPDPAPEAASGDEAEAAGAGAKAGLNLPALLTLLALLVLAVLALVFRKKLALWLKGRPFAPAAAVSQDALAAQEAATPQGPQPADTPASAPPAEAGPPLEAKQDDTVEYLTIPEPEPEAAETPEQAE